MRIKWAFTGTPGLAACLKREMKSKWKRFNQIIYLWKISFAANCPFDVVLCDMGREKWEYVDNSAPTTHKTEAFEGENKTPSQKVGTEVWSDWMENAEESQKLLVEVHGSCALVKILFQDEREQEFYFSFIADWCGGGKVCPGNILLTG